MSTYEGYSYRLRAGSPMPTSTTGRFVLHSFMAESQEQLIVTCATTLLTSSSFRGHGGGFSAARYNRIMVSGQPIYKASESENPKYIEEKE